jgi:uncharacterized membrane protein
MLLVIGGTGFGYWLKFREIHDRYGKRALEVRETSVAAIPQRESIRWWLVLPPFLAIAAVALYLRAHWNELPVQFPVHWGIDGQPNRWANRDFLGVYGTVLAATAMNLIVLAFAWTLTRITRRSIMRYVTMRMLEVLLYPLTFTLMMVALLPIVQLPVWLGPAVMLVFVAGVIYWAYGKITMPSPAGEIPDPQNDSYWKAGVFYFNPNDPAIFVSKRVGIGYTINFANKMAWFVLAGILLIAILPALLMKMK